MNIIKKVVGKQGIGNKKFYNLCKQKDRDFCVYLCISPDYPQYNVIVDALDVIFERPCREIWK